LNPLAERTCFSQVEDGQRVVCAHPLEAVEDVTVTTGPRGRHEDDTATFSIDPDSDPWGPDRVISDCHFKKTGTEYDRKNGIKWLRCTAK